MSIVPLSRILAYWSERRGADAPAVTHEDTTLSWQALDARSNRLARAYADLGVRADDMVTIALPNGVEFFEACFATWKLGATPQPISAKLPALEREAIIELAQPSLVVGAEGGAGRPSVPIGFEPDAALPDTPLEPAVASYFKAMTSGGSTGRPKLIVSHQPAEWDVDGPAFSIQPTRAMLCPGPLYHNGPFLWSMIALFRGGHVVVTTRFDAEATLALVERYRIETVYLVPTMMQRIWKLDEAVRTRYDVSSLRWVWHLAAPCPPWLKLAWIEWLGPDVIWELYGGTEGIGGTVIDGNEWLEHRGSVGRPNDTCEMRILDENGGICGPMAVGEVYMRPKEAAAPYHYLGAEPRVLEDRWESLGDMGYFDADGYLYLTDRRNDMVVSGGANIYPAEVEAAIDACPGVRSSAVIGLPHEDLGHAIHAIVDVAGGTLTAETLRAHLAERLVRYKIPRTFEFVDEPLRDDAGKVRRSALQAARVATAGAGT